MARLPRAKVHRNLHLDIFSQAVSQSNYMMGKRDCIKQVFRHLSHPCTKTSTSKSASATSGIALEPRLNESTDRTNGASSTDNPSQDAPVRDIWSLALEKLSLEDREAISQIKSDSKLDILQHLHTAAEKKRNDCEGQRWKFELRGRQIILRDVAEKIIVGIDKFKQIGDIAVSFDPVHASLPWAGIRFLLEMTVAESQQMGALLTGVEKITSVIGRCHIYEALYLGKEQSEQEEWKQVATNLTSALMDLYAVMLSFLGMTIQAYNQHTSRPLHAILNRSEVIGFLEKCQNLEESVAKGVDNCERIHTRRIQAGSEERMQKLKAILADLQIPIVRIDSRVANLCDRLDSSERRKILNWISGILYEENHYFAREGRTSRTGEWLLQHERYREWRASSASMILWLHGDPGAGKTKLVSTIVDDLLKTFKQLPNDEAFAYFYCDRNQSDRREPALILNSFVRQLSTYRNNVAIPHSTVQMYNEKQEAGFVSGGLKWDESRTVLADLLQLYPQVTLVVDALDECDRSARSAFIKTLDTLVDESPNPIKILISSRRDRDLKHRFEDGPNLEIRAIDNRDDIEMFVNYEIAASEKTWQDQISSELNELICSTLVDRSEGMFQWVSLQIAVLRELNCERDIRNRLGKLPKTLKAAYDELYSKIQSQEASTPIFAKRAFQWVMCSCWPLSPAELVAAVCQDPDTDEIDKVDINIDIVLGACQNLLVVDQKSNVCRFSHLSVQEYFETCHWRSYEPDCLVAKVCLSLLINTPIAPKQDAQPTTKEAKEESAHYAVLYACFNWVKHVQRLEEKRVIENRLTELLKSFLGSMDQSSLSYQNWHKMAEKYDLRSWTFGSSNGPPLLQLFGRLSPCSRASLAIVTYGLYNSILDWWTVGFADINEKNSSGDSLLLLGAMSGSVPIAKCLLEKGADVNASGRVYGSPVQAASYFGHESMVQLLLDKGAEINARGGKYDTALQAASVNGKASTVQLLLKNGADVNATGGEYGSALLGASKNGYVSIAQLLLNKGADVNVTGGWHGSALVAASLQGQKSMAQLLLDNGADVNVSSAPYGTALMAASESGHELIVQMLLDKGADVNASDEESGSALEIASLHGHQAVVQLLLDKGADVNTTGRTEGSALEMASSKGHDAVVQLLQAATKSQEAK